MKTYYLKFNEPRILDESDTLLEANTEVTSVRKTAEDKLKVVLEDDSNIRKIVSELEGKFSTTINVEDGGLES